MNYILDTNILLIYLRDQKTREVLDSVYSPLDLPNIPIISVVSIGELKSLAIQNNWGEKRLGLLDRFVRQFVIADINSADVLERYAEIDAYSQGRHPVKQLNSSARNMGKNDLWIAATASVTDSVLLTTDNDFDHLNKVFLNVQKVKLVK
jgi:predicted nucleic acid-binding protein